MDIDARAFGQLEGQVQALTLMMAAQKDTLAAQNDTLSRLSVKLDLLATSMSEARGGWKTLVWLGGMSATVASFITWAGIHLKP